MASTKWLHSRRRKTTANTDDPSEVVLPPEILLDILDCAPQPTALVLASVCRAWYAVAVSHRNFYLSIPLYRCAFYAQRRIPNTAPDPASAIEALEHAAQRGRRVALELHLIRPCRSYWDSIRDWRILRRMLVAVSAAMHSSVFRLNITCTLGLGLGRTAQDFDMRFLTLPAPRLESLICSTDSRYTSVWTNILSTDLFSGSAPRLRDVSLHGVYLPCAPVPAFKSVDVVRITTITAAALPISLLFPNAKSLNLTFAPFPLWNPSVAIHLTDTNLSRLTLSWSETVDNSLLGEIVTPLPEVRHLDISGFQYVSNLDANCDVFVSPCELQIDCVPKMDYPRLKLYTATFSSSGRQLKLPLGCSPDAWHRILGRVDTLRLTQRAISEFIHAIPSRLVLPALTSLIVEMTSLTRHTWPLDITFPQPNTLNCPALREVRIVWNGSTDPGAARPSISARHLDVMAFCLLIAPQSEKGRVSLMLHNIDYDASVEEHPIFSIALSLRNM